ncbi:MAG TPA: DEAD/DEAH box helicase family protein, partial [Methylomirabilota bacterium]|nr:DEAD/DEAH box helicase family protein [Methylomirabilota bacterium]
MPIDFSKLKAPPKEERLIDPIALFQRLRVTDASINDLWLAQGDALREWHKKRDEKDVAISLNTGAGKTLVGLLIGQSLVNEMRSMVLYACSSIQLVLQTAKKAEGYGLPSTTYVKGKFSNDLAAKGDAVCLTTYQALFNGKSHFFNREVAGIVFDDSHAAEHLLRDHYSLRITKERFGNVYSAIANEFADYFHAVGLASSFDEVISGTGHRLLLAPPFEVRRVHSAILKLLQESDVPGDFDATAFAWEHLKDRIDLCAFVISSSEITITPPFVPVRTLPYFSSTIRRVYLSATLSALDVFVRTFGRKPSSEIRPTTTAGECERMILIPQKMVGVADDLAVAKNAVRPYKSLILVPSYPRAEKWADLVKPPPKEAATEAIENFKQARGADKLLLTARYDGVDLPGDMCRVVVIDDLPSGVGPLERFLWEYLKFSSTLRTSIASRVVQSFGRISRGMSDHGVALITGRGLVEWLQVPKNLAALPRFLQKQLQLGFQMSADASGTDIPDMIKSCLGRERNWVDAYERYMREASHEDNLPEPATVAELALAEAKFAQDLWHRDFTAAASHLQKTLDDAGHFSTSTACWHKLWLGYALDCGGDSETATTLYQQAHTGFRNIPPLRPEASSSGLSPQALTVARQFELVGGRVRLPKTFDRDLFYLNGTGTTKQTEEALRCLGQYLGFEATRPDNEHDTGPDFLWVFPDKTGFCVDAKTGKGKEATTSYRKEDLGQLSDHVQWVRDNAQVEKIIPAFVGP